jgi:hypothetical protein
MNAPKHKVKCPCKSGKNYEECCKPYILDLNLRLLNRDETILLSWFEIYSKPIYRSFFEKTEKYLFRISCYLDNIVDEYLPLGYPSNGAVEYKKIDEDFFCIKHNILMSLFASVTSLSQGLFIQSGTLLRSGLEDCLVILDLCENKGQIKKYIEGKYSTNGLLTRVNCLIPDILVKWYGYFSANFSHFGPLHPAPYMPRACYPENWVIVIGTQNVMRGIVSLHIILEKIYYGFTKSPVFWKYNTKNNQIEFNDDSPVFQWNEKLGKEIVSEFPPGEKKAGCTYTEEEYKTKGW